MYLIYHLNPRRKSHILFIPFLNSYNFFCVEGEIDYVRVINRELPSDIRILGWCPVPVDFHARFVYIL